jgi:hypothetical protein
MRNLLDCHRGFQIFLQVFVMGLLVCISFLSCSPLLTNKGSVNSRQSSYSRMSSVGLFPEQGLYFRMEKSENGPIRHGALVSFRLTFSHDENMRSEANLEALGLKPKVLFWMKMPNGVQHGTPDNGEMSLSDGLIGSYDQTNVKFTMGGEWLARISLVDSAKSESGQDVIVAKEVVQSLEVL